MCTTGTLHRSLVPTDALTGIGRDPGSTGGHPTVVAGTDTLAHGCTSPSAFTARNWASSSASSSKVGSSAPVA